MLVLYQSMTVATALFFLYKSAFVIACLYSTRLTSVFVLTLYVLVKRLSVMPECLHRSAGIVACLYSTRLTILFVLILNVLVKRLSVMSERLS